MTSTAIHSLPGQVAKLTPAEAKSFDRLAYMRDFRDRPQTNPCHFECLANDGGGLLDQPRASAGAASSNPLTVVASANPSNTPAETPLGAQIGAPDAG